MSEKVMEVSDRENSKVLEVATTDKQINVNALPFKPGDWVKVMKKPKQAIAIKKGDVVQVEEVSPSKQMIRIGSPDFGWDYLNWNEIALTLQPSDVSLRDDSEASLRDDKQSDGCEPVATVDVSLRDDKPDHPLWEDSLYRRIMDEIKSLFNRLSPSLRDDILGELLSLRDDSIDASFVSFRDDKPRIVWRSPAKREDRYPWFEWRAERAYIGGGKQGNELSKGRVAKVLEWMAVNVPPMEIMQRIRAKQFD